MIEITNVQVSLPSENLIKKLKGALLPALFPNDREPALQNISLRLGRGESWGLLGRQDAGKTTLLRLLAGLIPPDSGTCQVRGRVAAVIDGEVPLLASETGEGNVRLFCRMEGLTREKADRRVTEVARMSGLDADYFNPVSGYDAPMRARLALSMALSSRANLLLIGNILDSCPQPYRQSYVMEIRKQIAAGTTLILESTDIGLMARLCEGAIWIQEGRLKQKGVFERVYEAYAFKSAASYSKSASHPKQWLMAQQAAFSEALTPADTGISYQVQSWPKEAQRIYHDQLMQLLTLNDQAASLAQANLAFEQENERLSAALRTQKERARHAEKRLMDLLDTLSDATRAMHALIVQLAQIKKDNAAHK